MDASIEQAGEGAIGVKGSQPDIEIVFRALSDPTRRAIVLLLAQSPMSVSALAAPLNVTITAVAQHIQVLEEAGLASSLKSGRTRTCQLETAGFDVLQQWIEQVKPSWEVRLNRLEAMLGNED